MNRRGLFALVPALVVGATLTKPAAPMPALPTSELGSEFWHPERALDHTSIFYDAARAQLGRRMREMGARYVVREDIYVEREAHRAYWHHMIVWEIA